MGAGFIRRFTTDPSLAELLAIEGVVVIDREQPAVPVGAGTGLVALVAEFEDGDFAPKEIASPADLLQSFGSFGFVYDGVPACNPCARARRADAALTPEYWNGNGYMALANKRFAGLVCVRVDASVGEVQFTRQASLSGVSDFSVALENGQTLIVDIGAGNVTATFTGAVATTTSAAGVYPTTFTGGEQITVDIEGTEYPITFLAADQTQVQVLARLNAAAGYTAFVAASPTTIRFDGRVKGTVGSIQIVSLDAAVATALGFAAAAAVAGTGNVPNLAAVTEDDAHAVVVAAVVGTRIDRDAAGRFRVVNTATPGTGTIEIDSTSTALAFGFTTDVEADAASGEDGVIPAGTRVRNSGGRELVTMQTVAVTADEAGPYTVKVRHAVDDGTGTSFAVSTATVMPSAIELGAFAVTNAEAIGAALTEAQLDAKYVEAIDKTKSVKSITKRINILFSARQSNIIRSRLRANVREASAQGCFGRVAVVRPPLGTTTRAQARSTTAQPGVGTYRAHRVIYAYPGLQTYVPLIALRGLEGGDGFSADGLVDTGADGWLASVMSLLNPEENPGQETEFLDAVTGLEAGNPDVQNMDIGDYKLFKAAGICAPRIDDGVTVFQSGVTSVDPSAHPNQTTISQRRFADFISDSLTPRMNTYVKKLATDERVGTVVGEVQAFLASLKSEPNRALARIEDYSIDPKGGNTPETIAAGIRRLKIKVRMLPSLDVIVLDTEVGQQVRIDLAA